LSLATLLGAILAALLGALLGALLLTTLLAALPVNSLIASFMLFTTVPTLLAAVLTLLDALLVGFIRLFENVSILLYEYIIIK
jgi:hypothetical protein